MGEVGRRSDGGVFFNLCCSRALEYSSLDLPNPSQLPKISGPPLLYVLVGDEAFPLCNYLLHPYPGRNLSGISDKIFHFEMIVLISFSDEKAIFNYCTHTHRWRLFRRFIIAKPANVLFEKAAIALHNYLRCTESSA